ncbi:MAG: MBL fold metallo-hydrolase [Nitrospinae bacterium]|nr:MBL fold metallo-hydrolase [Nitrospinota bacterium]
MGSLKILFLGTGTSTGVPMIGCHCRVCSSTDVRDNRLRTSALISWQDGPIERNVLIDASTDLRAQALRHGLERIDAVLFTHAHADHVHGIDELRSFNFIQHEEIPCYGPPDTLEKLRRRFDYIFAETAYEGGGKPKLSLHPVEPPFELFGKTVEPLPVKHGSSDVFGYRFGPLAYVTDCNAIPPATMEKMRGLRLLVMGAVQRKPHSTHFGVDEAVAAIRSAGAKKGYLTHMNHDILHSEVSAALPSGVSLAYDGLIESVDE